MQQTDWYLREIDVKVENSKKKHQGHMYTLTSLELVKFSALMEPR